ncbi:MAG: Type 1 glutamine amidotransferase-like domain-containing protein [Caldilineaceae bacterium]|nr:Type 1 glutamine amidotransferase-like domain-containing protein [Caldilineaceae bacterium]MDE0336692.1 Type 1 glutamine amidotransferase-like domain-containing protein [Caldilineaceae bacterium]
METGHLLLAGGSEFGGQMAAPDRRSIELAGGLDTPIAIIPTAAAPDNNHRRAGENGRRWFTNLGATNVQVVPVIDRDSAADSNVVEAAAEAKLIYLLGGFPGYLCETLRGSPAWSAMLTAYAGGAVLAGSSAGAMVLCQHLNDPHGQGTTAGLGLIPDAIVLPHHNTFGQGWADRLREILPDATLIGIDEETAMISEGPAQQWRVYGAGDVTLYLPGHKLSHPQRYLAGQVLRLQLPD